VYVRTTRIRTYYWVITADWPVLNLIEPSLCGIQIDIKKNNTAAEAVGNLKAGLAALADAKKNTRQPQLCIGDLLWEAGFNEKQNKFWASGEGRGASYVTCS